MNQKYYSCSMGYHQLSHKFRVKQKFLADIILFWPCVLSLQSCLTLCDPVNCSPPAPLSMGFFRQEYWSGLSFPPSGDHPDLGIEPASLTSPAWQAMSLPLLPPGKPIVLIFLYWDIGNIYIYILAKDKSMLLREKPNIF